MASFHETFGWVAIGAAALSAGLALLVAIRRRHLPRWFWWLGGTAIGAMVLQVLSGVYLYAQDERPGTQHMFYGFAILFTLTFGYVYRWQLQRNAALRWGLFLLFTMGLGIRAVMTFGESF
ncbi:MAG: hypothetical protein OEP52_02680 [Acidimicrobiia bacterium]|nr:hypothetical protein [Acidimicrobiia bacterium]